MPVVILFGFNCIVEEVNVGISTVGLHRKGIDANAGNASRQEISKKYKTNFDFILLMIPLFYLLIV